MPYCPNTKLFFIHIPKTGGSSIERVLNPTLMIRKEGPTHYGTSPQHLPLSHLEYEMPNFKECVFFTVVRNPFRRVLSEFLWRCGLNNIHYNSDSDIRNAFEHFLQYTLYELSKEERIVAFDRHLETQYSFIQHSHILVNIFKIEEITLLENWLTTVLKKPIQVPHLHKTSSKKDYSFILKDIKLKNLITQFYKVDFDFFNYSSD